MIEAEDQADFATKECEEMVKVGDRILNLLTQNGLSAQDPFGLLSKEESSELESKMDQSGVGDLVSEFSEHLANVGWLCDDETRSRIAPIQQTLGLCKHGFYMRIGLEPTLKRLSGILLDSSNKPFKLVGLDMSVDAPEMSPEEYWEAMFRQYRKHAAVMMTQLQALLSGTIPLTTPSKPEFTEAWITYSLFWQESDSPVPLEFVLASADFAQVLEPTANELAWAFLQLRKRAWLLEGGTAYGLTSSGWRSVNEIAGKGSFKEGIKRLEEWIRTHSP